MKRRDNIRKNHETPSYRPPWADLIVPLLAIFGLYWFSAGFFLAKRQLPYSASCDEGPTLLRDILGLTPEEVETVLAGHDSSKGCWLNRRIDSLAILVVDALRFDFARYHLPMSVGARIAEEGSMSGKKHLHRTPKGGTTSSQLLQFVADPPTVTMQRLKGLTTGSLPTFADISGNFGGSSIDEDSWVQQLKDTPFQRRGMLHPSRMGFVGDDTWVDLFPTQFEESFPFPSFNTRDLDTVDNGCLKELPRLLQHIRTSGNRADELEIVVSHFLGVDHVGHTYGPHDEHMAEKLNQMDVVLSTTLDILDESDHCHLALIFGDHGMTEDGNHGGGTENEINAALFVHFSPACGEMPLDSAPQMGSKYIQDAFQSIHQIDLVPTISILLGLPIPYANLGGIVPSLLGYHGIKDTAGALALNAAQVWRYFSIYSATANKLPRLSELKERLDEAIGVYKEALSQPDAADSNAFHKASGLFKIFLVEASELGHQVWTRFDTVGMVIGGTVVFLALLLWISSLYIQSPTIRLPPVNQYMEIGMAALFVFFQSGMLSFSNSYIEAEQAIVMYMMGILGFTIFLRFNSIPSNETRWTSFVPLLLPAVSRVAELFVSGHGLDPSLRVHMAHSCWVFLPSLLGSFGLRIFCWYNVAMREKNYFSIGNLVIDVATMTLFAMSWIQKRSLNHDEIGNGFVWMRIAIALILLSTPITVYEAYAVGRGELAAATKKPLVTDRTFISRGLPVVVKLLLLLAAVTGPASAATLFLACLQGCLLYLLSGATGVYEVSSPVLAVLWRLVVRHTFFATNHGCAFNRLQYSAAFVATMEFDFRLGGLQLFVNTFGYEIIGNIVVFLTAMTSGKSSLWRYYCFYQIIESFLNCISVSILRRHLMVWAVYAPRFLFSSIFLILNCTGQMIIFVSSKFGAA